MAIFRDNTPSRRNITRAVSSYRDHKADLKIDFASRCGWCNSADSWKTTYFEVDHFIPDGILTIKSKTDYSNLIYSCRSCNNAKRKKWPTGDQNIPNQNDEGFIDPCDNTYSQQFERNEIGEIQPITKLGSWMHTELNLHKPQHQIIWQLERLEPIVAQIKQLSNDILSLPSPVKDIILGLMIKYDNYRDQLRNI